MFALLSLADLALSWWLLGLPGEQVHEGNLAARWWLDHYGWPGLCAFKAALVVLFGGLAAVISRHCPRTGGRVLGAGCAVLVLVVAYSVALGVGLYRSPEAQELSRALQSAGAFKEKIRTIEAYRPVLAEVCERLVAGRCSLADAVDRLAATEQGGNLLRTWASSGPGPGRPPRESLAASVIVHVVRSVENDPQAAWRAALRLEREFELTYGGDPPREHRKVLSRGGSRAGRPGWRRPLSTASVPSAARWGAVP
jgi:hypothetical protein